MSAVDQSLTLAPIPATPLVLCAPAFLNTLAQVEREVAHMVVADGQSAQAASNILQRLTTAGTQLEKARTELKAPFIAKGREIDDAAKAPAERIETAKRRVKAKVSAWQEDEQRKAYEAEQARIAELRRLEALRLEEERAAKAKADELALIAAENAARIKAPVVDFDFDEGPAEPAPKTETEKAIEAVKFTPAPVAAKPVGIAFRATLRIASIDVNLLPEPFVIRTPDQVKIRATFATGWKDGDPIPECAGVTFAVDRTPVSTGRAVF